YFQMKSIFFFLGSLTLTLLQIREEAYREERVDGKIKLILGERFGIWLLYCKLLPPRPGPG
uniref:Uncharacterized protein n=1 Tax=Oreochromis niloticus TaxID=8128 RepID=A0A669C224_ORENI